MVTHKAKVIHRDEVTITTTLCGRMNRQSMDGMNSSDSDSLVTCKFCQKIMASWHYRNPLDYAFISGRAAS